MGANDSKKTHVINTLLGEDQNESDKRTADCVRREGVANGRKLLLIDTPGWVGYYPLIDTAEFIKRKLILSVSMIPPGPHAFIVVVGTDTPFTEKNRRSIEEHLGLFGENIWEYTIVGFTRGDSLEGKTVEQHINSEGDTLKWLVEKCGNRCHMIDIHSTEGCYDMRKLLEQIDSLAKTRKSYFELDKMILKEAEEKRNTCWERAKQRWQKVSDQREMLHKQGK